MSSVEGLMAPVSVGELVDKITILQIKSARIEDEGKLVNVRGELRALQGILAGVTQDASVDFETLLGRLREVNQALWDIEDDIRLKESQGDFGAEFVQLARSVYITNDERSRIKKEINILLKSGIVEEKSYSDYQNHGPASA